MESDIIHFMTCNTIISAFHSFLNGAKSFPKELEANPAPLPPPPPPPRGATAHAKAKNPSPQKKIFSLCRVRIEAPRTARILGVQNSERKTPFPFSRKNSPPPNQQRKECFFFRGCWRTRQCVGLRFIRSVSARKKFAQSV